METLPEAGDVVAAATKQVASVVGGTSLKSSLRGWREIVVVCAKLIKWKQMYFAAIVFGVISLFYLIIWWLDPSVLTTISMLMMIVCLADYLVPLAMPMVFPETSWSNEKEKQYVQACDDLVHAKNITANMFRAAGSLKDKNPWLYLAATTVSLSTLAWLGNQMHNLLLIYLLTLVIFALPGLKEHGLLDKALAQVKKLTKKEKAQ